MGVEIRRVTLNIQETNIELLAEPGIEPTPFSLFLANLIRVRATDRVAVDVGAGGGVLSIVLARLGVQRVVAVERSSAACSILRRNAVLNGVDDRIELVPTDFRYYRPDAPVDLIVSNPPTVPEIGEVPDFGRGAGPDGFEFVEALLLHCGGWLRNGGTLQMVLSSLVDWRRFLATCRTARLVPRRRGTLIVPFRDYYWPVYGEARLHELERSSRVVVHLDRGKLSASELIAIVDCVGDNSPQSDVGIGCPSEEDT